MVPSAQFGPDFNASVFTRFEPGRFSRSFLNLVEWNKQSSIFRCKDFCDIQDFLIAGSVDVTDETRKCILSKIM